jgi:hypothetical protein
MQFRTSISGDLRQEFAQLGRQMQFAAVLALTRTALKTRDRLREHMEEIFDRPVPFTLNALQVRPATRERPEAEVGFREFAGKGVPAGKYLRAQIEGGARALKRFERNLQHNGLMPRGLFAVPGYAADLDRYGNMSAGQIVKILSALKASSDYLQNRSSRRRSRGSRRAEEYFSVGVGSNRGGLKPGVYKRGPNGQVFPVIRFVRQPMYRRVFDFYGQGERIAGEVYGAELLRATEQALSSARR